MLNLANCMSTITPCRCAHVIGLVSNPFGCGMCGLAVARRDMRATELTSGLQQLHLDVTRAPVFKTKIIGKRNNSFTHT